MTRFIHDQFAKDYLEEFLKPYGEVRAGLRVRSEQREIDVFFEPSSPPSVQTLGLLGRLAQTPCIFEPFRNPATADEISDCMIKSLEMRRSYKRKAARKKSEVTSSQTLKLWILTPTASHTILSQFRAIPEENGLPGFYFLPPHFQGAIIVIHKLPRTRETLWLRVLGREKVQEQAIAELEQLEENNPLRSLTLELLYSLQLSLKKKPDLDKDEKELIMRLTPLYQQDRALAVQEGMDKGIQQGVVQERRNNIENIMRARFGALDPALEGIIEPLLVLPSNELTPLLLELSRSELLSRFQQRQN